jgi:hypothetical protein
MTATVNQLHLGKANRFIGRYSSNFVHGGTKAITADKKMQYCVPVPSGMECCKGWGSLRARRTLHVCRISELPPVQRGAPYQ